jgi:hypothetical protein
MLLTRHHNNPIMDLLNQIMARLHRRTMAIHPKAIHRRSSNTR